MTDHQATESSSGTNLPPSQTLLVERIFPIRNLVDEATDVSDANKLSGEDIKSPPESNVDEYLSPPFPNIPPEDQIRRLPAGISKEFEYSSHSDGDGGRLKVRKVTERVQLVPERHGGAPGAVLMEGGKSTFHRCEDEPIHTPGAIQQYGALVALKYAPDEYDGDVKNVLVRIASENSEHILGYNPEQLFQLTSFCDLLSTTQKKDFMVRFEHVLEMGHSVSGNTDLDVFTMTLLTRNNKESRYWCALHLSTGTNDLVICEFETQEDTFFPGAPGVQTLPQTPVRTLDNDVVEEERAKSITSRSQPLRALQVARQQQSRIGFMEMFNSMSQVQSQLAAVKDLQEALDVVVGIVQEMTHFHRVMVYRFDGSYNGAVQAEIVDPRASEDFFRGRYFSSFYFCNY
jgi:hypothetical protein